MAAPISFSFQLPVALALIRYIYIIYMYIIFVPKCCHNNKFILLINLQCANKRWPLSNAGNLKLG